MMMIYLKLLVLHLIWVFVWNLLFEFQLKSIINYGSTLVMKVVVALAKFLVECAVN